MTKYIIYPSLLALPFFTFCNGQVKTDLSIKNSDSQKQNINEREKIIKTLGSNKYENIHCGLQDKAGNLWFGTTSEGVYRYDGKLFTQFTIQNGLNSNTIWSMLEDKKGNIWFGTKNGLCCYDGMKIAQISMSTNNILPSYSVNSTKPSAINEVFSIMQDKKGKIWFGTTEGIVCYDGNNFTHFLDNYTIINDSILTLKSVQCIFEDKEGNIWFGSGPMAFEGIAMFNGKSLTKFKPRNQVWIRQITEDKNSKLLFATRGAGIISYDVGNFSATPKPMKLRNDLLMYFLTDSKGSSWYASDYVNDDDVSTGGFWKFDGKTEIEFTKNDGLSNTSVSFILEDRNGSIWIGTRDIGLYRYDGKAFTCYSD
jgi:ligand-binding sensor domain-containing protein